MRFVHAKNRRAATTLAATVLAAGALAFAAPTAMAGSSVAPVATPRVADYDCPRGAFCIYSDWNGNGERCDFYGNDPSAGRSCGFSSRNVNVRSAYNNTAARVNYYTSEGYRNRIGSETPGNRTNLAGNYVIRSVKF
ncbi:peptidase inhibitor family I36 protein [Streptomyces sp. NPDC050610]|uniref:peptidase inhibitor family I36 protein n=1 Tax=Streptomyces sp. NPDC050610 TaxID=3157097 RepID=UPI0034435A7F